MYRELCIWIYNTALTPKMSSHTQSRIPQDCAVSFQVPCRIPGTALDNDGATSLELRTDDGLRGPALPLIMSVASRGPTSMYTKPYNVWSL